MNEPTSPEDRLEHFWQADNLRLYGTDVGRRLAEDGLTVLVDPCVGNGKVAKSEGVTKFTCELAVVGLRRSLRVRDR